MKLATEAPINGGRNYDGPKVNYKLALVKSGQMLESLVYPTVLARIFFSRAVKIRLVQVISRKDRRLQLEFAIRFGILRDYTPDVRHGER